MSVVWRLYVGGADDAVRAGAAMGSGAVAASVVASSKGVVVGVAAGVASGVAGGVPDDDGAWLLMSSCRSSATCRLPTTIERARGSRTEGVDAYRRTGDVAVRPSRGALRGSAEAGADVDPNMAGADADADADVDADADADPAPPASETKALPTMLPRLSRAKRVLRVSSTCRQACKRAIRGPSEGHQRAIRVPSEWQLVREYMRLGPPKD